jgi:nicotinamide-nucleotide amidase
MGAGELIVEVIAVGTELLIGQIVNSNAASIGARLADEGIDAHFQVTVGDNLPRMITAIEQALSRSDAVLITGGIGPTQDDLTREAICRVADRPMTRDRAHAAWIEERIRAQTGALNPTVLRMADLPEGAEALPNVNGVALGLALEVGGKWVFAVPGVPVEMTAMVDGQVLPRLRALGGEPSVLRSRTLRIWGMGESRIAEMLDDLFGSTNPSIAFLIHDMEVNVRITAKGDGAAEAEALIRPMEDAVRARLGDLVFGVDEETVEALISADLANRGWTLATVERATLGRVGARIAETEGPGRVFAATAVPGGSDLAAPEADVLVTVGTIGAKGQEGPPLTRPVMITVSTPERSMSRTFDLGGDDERVRSFATIAALHMIRLALVDVEPS